MENIKNKIEKIFGKDSFLGNIVFCLILTLIFSLIFSILYALYLIFLSGEFIFIDGEFFKVIEGRFANILKNPPMDPNLRELYFEPKFEKIYLFDIISDYSGRIFRSFYYSIIPFFLIIYFRLWV